MRHKIAVFTAAVLIGAAIGERQVQADKQLEHQITAAQKKVTTANKLLQSLQKQLTSLQAQQQSLTSQITQAKGTLQTMSTPNIAGLQSQLTSLNNQLASVNAQVNQISSKVSDAKSAVSSLTGQLNSLNGQISQKQNDLTLAQKLESEIKAHNSSVTSGKQQYTTLQQALQGYTSQEATLKTELQTRQQVLNQLNAELGQTGALDYSGSCPLVAYGYYTHGDVVLHLQEALTFLGFNPVSNQDGYYGPITKQSIQKFQASQHISTDGEAGPITYGRLNSALQAYGGKWQCN